jgi:phosphopantothenoylcysteine decarboxylase/phosphopantothenate--cysteine ligase
MGLKNKRVLITAGPTWVAIDRIRVISNTATGKTGILLAERLQDLGAKVTLLIGPVPNVAFLRSVSSGFRRYTKIKTVFGIETCCLNKNIKLIRFNFFNELKDKLTQELLSKKYDVIIHSAAVSDYRPLLSYKKKVRSGRKKWNLALVPTQKIVDLIKKIDRALFAVGFKFEPDTSKCNLIRSAERLLRHGQLDLVVGNTIKKNKYLAYIVARDKISGIIRNKKDLTQRLIKAIEKNGL